MSTLRNSVQLIGHLGADPKVKNLENGSKNVTLNIATNESYKVKGEWKEETQWHRVVAWNRTADRAEEYLKKGSFVLIEGKLTHRNYEDSKGETRFITEVRAQNFILLDRKSSDDAHPKEKVGVASEKEDLPF